MVIAELAALGSGGAASADGEGTTGVWSLRLGGLAPLMGAGALLVLGLVLCGEGRRTERVWRLDEAAERLRDAALIDDFEHRIALLTRAVQLDPSDARVRLALGEAYEGLFAGQVKARQGDWPERSCRGDRREPGHGRCAHLAAAGNDRRPGTGLARCHEC